jgi:DNA-binding MarR family transcriptional regulator
VLELLGERGFADIRAAHGKVFETVSGEGARLTDMAERALLTKQSMQYLVDDLERLGYVERIPDPGDRRAKLVRLTARGRQVVIVGREAIAALEERWIERLGEAKMRRLRRLLEELSHEAPERAGFGPQA